MARTAERPAAAARDPARRRRVLAAARRMFAAYGFRGTRLDDVAAEAGCAKGALYLEFADKESLLRAVVDEVFAEVRARFEAEVVALPSPRERLVATLRFALREALAEPLFFRLMRDDPELAVLRPPEAAEAQAAAARAQIGELLGWVDAGVAAGELRPDLDRDALPLVIGLLRALPQHLPMIAGMMPPERVLAAVVDIFAAGLAAPAPRAGRPGVRRSKRRARA
jgi:TetR/AcrR family fatty acid metabolism transcriptional regulator